MMTGYNLLNGVYCTENKYLIDILKKEWGFKGMLMSDWACTYSADKAANHGLDLEMGSNDWFVREKLLPLIEQGVVTEETINEKVRRIYGTCIEMGFLTARSWIRLFLFITRKPTEWHTRQPRRE